MEVSCQTKKLNGMTAHFVTSWQNRSPGNVSTGLRVSLSLYRTAVLMDLLVQVLNCPRFLIYISQNYIKKNYKNDSKTLQVYFCMKNRSYMKRCSPAPRFEIKIKIDSDKCCRAKCYDTYL